MVIILAGTTQPAAARELDTDRVQLGVKPVGVDGSYFDLTMSPGDSRQVTVTFGNYGTRNAVAMTYPADVYSLVNGGMGVRLAGEPTGGTTGWLGFEAETIQLAAGEATMRTFAVSVPLDTTPGEYITSIVIQDATPVDETSDSGVTANRVNRQAIAVAVTVPGPVAPGLTLGDVEHHIAGGRSVIAVEVANTGNVRLQPSGELVVTAASGSDSARFTVRMESVYAGTSTLAEIPFTTILEPGAYTVVLSLTDSTHAVTATTPALDLTVPVAGTQALAPLSSIAQAASVSQPTGSSDGSSALSLTSTVAGVLALALAAFVVTKRRQPRAETVRVPAPAMSATPASAVVMARPVTIRQLDVPRRHEQHPAEKQPGPSETRFKKLAPSRGNPHFATSTITSTSKGA